VLVRCCMAFASLIIGGVDTSYLLSMTDALADL
jgi:hypothetical protein